MNHNIITNRIEVRGSSDKKNPRYIVNGCALVPDKFDSYNYIWDTQGNITDVKKSMFTKHCIESIKRQAQHKKLFVDTKHELGFNTNIKGMLKGKITLEEEKKLDSMLKSKLLPIAKLTDININENGLFVETELNPLFREIDEDHKRYFDAVWYSLENKFLNGISINFMATDVIQDEKGRDIINDIDIAGFSYVDRPSLPEHNISEVAMRSAQDYQEGVKMEDEKKKLEAEKAKVAEDRKNLDEEKKKIEDEKAKKAEEDKQAEIKKQAEEKKATEEALQKKADDLKAKVEALEKREAELNRAKGVVTPKQPTSISGGTKVYDEKFYKEQIAEITKEHDETMKLLNEGKQPLIDNRMKGFGEIVNLAAQAGNPTADLDSKNAEFVKEHKLLDKAGSDIITPRRTPAT